MKFCEPRYSTVGLLYGIQSYQVETVIREYFAREVQVNIYLPSTILKCFSTTVADAHHVLYHI